MASAHASLLHRGHWDLWARLESFADLMTNPRRGRAEVARSRLLLLLLAGGGEGGGVGLSTIPSSAASPAEKCSPSSSIGQSTPQVVLRQRLPPPLHQPSLHLLFCQSWMDFFDFFRRRGIARYSDISLLTLCWTPSLGCHGIPFISLTSSLSIWASLGKRWIDLTAIAPAEVPITWLSSLSNFRSRTPFCLLALESCPTRFHPGLPMGDCSPLH